MYGKVILSILAAAPCLVLALGCADADFIQPDGDTTTLPDVAGETDVPIDAVFDTDMPIDTITPDTPTELDTTPPDFTPDITPDLPVDTTPDAPCSPLMGGSCNMISNCNCAAGEKCGLALNPTDECDVIESCAPGSYTIPAGSPCTSGSDECVAGSSCMTDSGTGTSVCMEWCFAEGDCSMGMCDTPISVDIGGGCAVITLDYSACGV
ncbi:MAG: hypothetical protein ABIJ56_18075 [Pseudomonadota bacterium]